MNLRTTPPELPQSWRGGISECCRALGREGKPVDYKTFLRWAERLNQHGRYNKARGVMMWSGMQINKMWYCLT